MASEDPLDEALHQLKNIVRLLQNNLYTLVDVKDVKNAETAMKELQTKFQEYQKKAHAEFQSLGVTKEQQKMIREGEIPEEVTGDYREILEITNKLKQQIEEMRNIARSEQAPAEETQKPPEKDKEKPHSKYRYKKKFKHLEGDDWRRT